MADTRTRSTFQADELAICLSHFDLGLIHQIREFPRGSRRAPKIVIECDRGQFLFKRRSKGTESLDKIAFTHQIQLALAAQNFPLPHLLGTKTDGNSMLVLGDQVYEMQEYIEAEGYDGSVEQTAQAGHALGLYHKLLAKFESDYDAPTGSYHNAKAIYHSVGKTRNALHKPTHELLRSVEFLEKSYKACAKRSNHLGLKQWPRQIVHGDWHPGNMLFRDKLVVAVIDYDTARSQQRIIDLANGVLQFSILGGGDDPMQWPEYLDLKRGSAFLRAYDKINVISTDELRAIPFLMCEAIIAEAVLPIATTGGFGRFEGGAFLTMIHRKVHWILTHAKDIINILGEIESPLEDHGGDTDFSSDALSGLADIAIERATKHR